MECTRLKTLHCEKRIPSFSMSVFSPWGGDGKRRFHLLFKVILSFFFKISDPRLNLSWESSEFSFHLLIVLSNGSSQRLSFMLPVPCCLLPVYSWNYCFISFFDRFPFLLLLLSFFRLPRFALCSTFKALNRQMMKIINNKGKISFCTHLKADVERHRQEDKEAKTEDKEEQDTRYWSNIQVEWPENLNVATISYIDICT